MSPGGGEPAGGDDAVMIRLCGVGKEYRLGQIGSGMLRRDLESWWAKKRGREDPNRKIGAPQGRDGERFRALKDISLTIRKGETVGIIGGNGAGKSTMLKLISRVTGPTEGTIDLYGRVTSMLEVGTGFHGELTGRENIYLNGTILGMTRREIDEVLEDIIEFSGLREFIDTPVKRYSSGMYVRLGFSVAAHLASEIVIMDEVLAVGDLEFQSKCLERMRRAAQEEGRTVLYVSHNLETVKNLCSRCLVLDRGEIVFDGDTEEAIARYRELSQPGSRRELQDYVRRSSGLTGDCRILAVRMEAADVPADGELVLTADLHARRPLPEARLRLVVSDDGGVILGMAYSDAVYLPEGMSRCTARFGVSPLAPGTYRCDAAVFEYDGLVQRRHDFVDRAVTFTVGETVRLFGKEWKAGVWGHVLLGPLSWVRTDGEK